MAEVADRPSVRDRIVSAAAAVMRDEGPAGVTTRAVARAAAVQAPTIYRLFGDKDGLLEAVAEHAMAANVAAKAEAVQLAAMADLDPVEDLRASWLQQIEFGVANPGVFRLLSDPDRIARSPAARSGRRVLEERVHRIAAAGRLAVEETQAVDLVQAAGVGVIQTLLARPSDERSTTLSGAMLDAVLARIVVDPPEPRERTVAATLNAVRALVPRLDALTDPERRLLVEWVGRALEAL